MPTEPTSAALREEAGPRIAPGGVRPAWSDRAGRTDHPGPTRVRRQLRDATAVAAVSLTGSLLVVAAVWAVGAWLS